MRWLSHPHVLTLLPTPCLFTLLPLPSPPPIPQPLGRLSVPLPPDATLPEPPTGEPGREV